jgi:hypothetical protein
LSFRAEVGLRVRRVWLCLFQTVKRLPVVPVALVSLPAAWLLLPMAWLLQLEVSVLLPVAPDPACLLDRVKLVVPQPQPELMDSHQLLPVGFLHRARLRQLAAARSWDFPS